MIFTALSYGWMVRAFPVAGSISLGATVISLTTLTSLISFGALVAFSAVNLSVVKHYAVDHRQRSAGDLLRYLVAPLVGFALTIWLWTSLSGFTFVVGLSWLALGALYLAWLTRGFRRPPPEVEFAD